MHFFFPSSLKGIQRNLLLYGCFFCLVFVGIMLYSANILITQGLSVETEKRYSTLGIALLAPLEKAIDLNINMHEIRYANDHFQAALEGDQEITNIAFYDSNYHKLYHASQKKPSPIKNPQEIEIPFDYQGKTLGFLKINMNIEWSKENFWQLSQLFFLCLFTCILTTQIFYAISENSIKRPLVDLKKSFEECAQNHYTYHEYTPKSTDEIQELSHFFYKFTRKINTLFLRIQSKVAIQNTLKNNSFPPLPKEFYAIEKNINSKNSFHTRSSLSLGFLDLALFLFISTESFLEFFILCNSESHSAGAIVPFCIFIAGCFSAYFFQTFFKARMKKPIFYSCGFYGLGIMGELLAYNAIDFVFWRFISGIGFGLLLIILQQEKNLSLGKIIYGLVTGVFLSISLLDHTSTQGAFVLALLMAFSTMVFAHYHWMKK